MNNIMQSPFPNVNIALRMLTLPVFNCTDERSFSHVKRIKNYERFTLLQERGCQPCSATEPRKRVGQENRLQTAS